MVTFNIQGSVVNKSTGAGIPYATVKVYQLGMAQPLGSGSTSTSGQFSLNFTWPYDVSILSNRPDVHFKVTQRVDGAERIIYNENPATETRKNIADVLAVTLKASEGVSTIPAASTPRPTDTLFVFTRVGIIGVNQIDTASPTASGYAYPDVNSAGPNSTDANAPFGATLDIAGWFGQSADVYRYKVQYSTDGATWHDISDPLSNTYYEFALGGGTWRTIAMGPFSEGGQVNVYKLPYVEQPAVPWVFPDLIARWDSTKVAAGRYTLRIQGFKVDSTATLLVPSSSLIIDPAYGLLRLQVDNTPPEVSIGKMMHYPPSGPAQEVQVCDIVHLTTGRLEVSFTARDTLGHLRAYSLYSMFGHNQTAPMAPGAMDAYAAHVGPTQHWTGSVFTAVYDGAGTFKAAFMPTCAYQFRLQVSKRTTNGYGLIYNSVEDTKHITLQR
ncbi:MAG TPA: hypothetical protein VHN14_17960 [Kofleriaceae bacterium]|jgi:hypothetical protein|nr:hypothetical protein [Kofleriaceae bacterium]